MFLMMAIPSQCGVVVKSLRCAMETDKVTLSQLNTLSLKYLAELLLGQNGGKEDTVCYFWFPLGRKVEY